MPKPPVPDHIRAFLTKPNPSVIATVRPDGQPVSVPTWYVFDDDGRIVVNMDEGRRRLDYLRHDPRVSVTVMDEGSWYTHVSVQGRVVELTEDVDLSDVDRIAVHYTGKPYPVRDRRRFSAYIEIEQWHGWGAFAQPQ